MNIEETEYRYTTTVKINKMEGDTKDIYKNKKFLLYVKKSRKTKLKYGQQIKIIGFYDKTEGRRNYKGSNYQEYLKNKKIYGILNCEDELKIIKDNNINPISMLIYRVRDKLKNNVYLFYFGNALFFGVELNSTTYNDVIINYKLI